MIDETSEERKDLSSWAAELNRTVYSEWKTNYPNWELGFRTLFGPPRLKPDIAIVSLNPGGSHTSTLRFQSQRR